jgi:hypothetical protein
MFTGISAILRLSAAASLKAPFPSSRVFHRYEPASANDPPPSGLCNTRLDSHGAQTARNRKGYMAATPCEIRD